MSAPSNWDEVLVAAEVVDRRSGRGLSWSPLAQAIGPHAPTLTAMRDGDQSTDQATVDEVVKRIPYPFPAEVNLLDRDEREAIDRMIELLVCLKISGGRNDDQRSGAHKSPQVGGDRPKDSSLFVGCAAYSPGTPTDRERMENEWGDELVQPVGSPAIDPHSDLVWGGLPCGWRSVYTTCALDRRWAFLHRQPCRIGIGGNRYEYRIGVGGYRREVA